MKVAAIIQARTGSTRLPAKVLKGVCGIPVLVHVVNRTKRCKKIDEIIVATTVNPSDDAIVELLKDQSVKVYRGSEKDVLARYYEAAKAFGVDVIVRITSDNPLLDYDVVDKIIDNLFKNSADYSCNNMPPSYPYGLDCECFTFAALEKAYFSARLDREREHVTPYIRENKDIFKIVNTANDKDHTKLRWTLDTEEDYQYIKEIYENLYHKDKYFTSQDILDYLEVNDKQ